MQFDPYKHHRRSIRMRGYDYSQAGAYFITICIRNRECILGDVEQGNMRPNRSGRLVQAAWHDLPNHYPHVMLDAFVVMPNHVHGIIVLQDAPEHTDVGAGFVRSTEVGDRSPDLRGATTADGEPKPAPTHRNTKRHGLPEIVRAFKTFSARHINRLRGTSGVPVWQRNYYERVIRNERELHAIQQYILDNPANWDKDRENPDVQSRGNPCGGQHAQGEFG